MLPAVGHLILCAVIDEASVGFVAAAVSMSTGGCRAISFDEVSVAAELAVL